MGLFQKTAKFIGIDKFGKGLASAGRVLTGGVSKDRQVQQEADASVQKLLYAARQEKDTQKKARLLALANAPGIASGTVQEGQIDPGLNLTNREVLGSAANVILNVATPGAFKGGKAAVLGKNALLGAGFGMAQGLEKNRSAKGVVGSAVGGAVIGTAVGGIGLFAKAAREFVGQKVPETIMNKAVKPALQDLKKNVKYGTNTLGKELLDEGVKGGPKKLLEIADNKMTSLENELQTILSSPSLKEVTIRRDKIYPYLRDIVAQKQKVPGGMSDIQRIKSLYNDLPEKMSLQQANEMKRAIYQELRDVSYKLDAKLTGKATALKQIARGLKTEIENEVGGSVVQDINKKLSIYGRLENSMVDQLAREMRNNGIGLTDAILLAGGDTGILALLRHVGQGVETNIAQGLSKVNKIGTGLVGRTIKSTLKRASLNAP